WYPKDQKRQARVDEYLEWQHNNTRAFCALYFQKKVCIIFRSETNPDSLEKFKDNMVACLNNIENIWLADTPYLSGDQISAADIFAACEIEQTRIAGFDPTEGRPILGAWLEKVRNETSPFYEEAHTVLNKLAQQAKEPKIKARL
ncbi:GST C domain containing protein, partial [Asbolus verrucosus]